MTTCANRADPKRLPKDIAPVPPWLLCLLHCEKSCGAAAFIRSSREKKQNASSQQHSRKVPGSPVLLSLEGSSLSCQKKMHDFLYDEFMRSVNNAAMGTCMYPICALLED